MSKYKIKERIERLFTNPEGESALEKFVRVNGDFYDKIEGNWKETAYKGLMFAELVIGFVDIGLPFEARYAAVTSLVGELAHAGAFNPETGLLSHIRYANRKL